VKAFCDAVLFYPQMMQLSENCDLLVAGSNPNYIVLHQSRMVPRCQKLMLTVLLFFQLDCRSSVVNSYEMAVSFDLSRISDTRIVLR